MRRILGLKKISEHDHSQKECSAFTTSNVIRLQLFTFFISPSSHDSQQSSRFNPSTYYRGKKLINIVTRRFLWETLVVPKPVSEKSLQHPRTCIILGFIFAIISNAKISGVNSHVKRTRSPSENSK